MQPASLISVILPVHEGRKHVDRAVRAVRTQSFSAWELLAVDDGSSDGTWDILAQHAAADHRVRPFHWSRSIGPSAARNVALQAAQGDLITYLDADDEYYPDYLEHVAAWPAEADVCIFAYDCVDEGVGVLAPGDIATWEPATVGDSLMEANIACPLGVAHRRSLLTRSGLFDESLRLREDWDLWKRFALCGARFVYRPHKSGLYHIRPGSLSHPVAPACAAVSDRVPGRGDSWPERVDAVWAGRPA